MKNNKLLLVSALLLSQIVTHVNAEIVENKVNPELIESIVNNINMLENVKPDVVETGIMYDIHYSPSFVCLNFQDTGYAIADLKYGELLQYDLTEDSPFRNTQNHEVVYAGPFNYYYLTKKQINEKKGLSVSKEFSDLFDSVMEEIDRDHKMKAEKSAVPKSVPASAWQNYGQTIYLNSIRRYAGGTDSNVYWRNNSTNYPNQYAICPKGICGTISSAALLAYYDDHQDSDYIPYTLWKNTNTSNPKNLVTTLFAYIDQGVPSGSVASNLKNGINTFITVKSLDSTLPRATSSVVPQNARNKINAQKPVCISTFAEPTYGAHWLLAYDYANYNSTTYFKCIDNWGSYSAVVRINSVTGYVYIQG